jgi:chemotaxis protein methyltransferase CheR
MEDSQLNLVLDRFGYSRAGFRKVRRGVQKRLARHMQETGCRNIRDYIEFIEMNQRVRLEFERRMTVSISRFFRDRGLWEKMQWQILPLLAGKSCEFVKVWAAGCASGEEVYSIKILWEDLRGSYARIPDLSILATDMNPEYLDRARAAVYPRSSLREIPEEVRSTYFETLADGKYALTFSIKEGIVWLAHNLLSDPPGIGFDLILLRNNLLTYYADGIKIPAFLRVIDSLASGGFLVVGSHERIPAEQPDLKHWGDSAYIFQKGG